MEGLEGQKMKETDRGFIPEIEISQKGKLAIQAALDGGRAIMEKASSMSIERKEGFGNFLTSCDLASEEAVMSLIKTYFPKDLILTEETELDVPNILEIENLWIIDPLDGTNNLVYGRQRSSVSVAFVSKGETLAAAVYDPFHQEMYFAERDKGSYLNGRKLEVARRENITEAVVTTDPAFEPQIMRRHLELLLNLPKIPPRILIRGSSVLSICEIAARKTDLFFHSNLGSWDTAASLLIVKEAGGIVRRLDGSEANLLSKDVVVGNQALVDEFIKLSKNLTGKNIK